MAGPIDRQLTAILVFLGLATPAAAGVEIGQSAPPFRLQDQKGGRHSLKQYAGRWVVLYFYPKDDTPGCTKEACAFGDNIFAFGDIGVVVLGVSLDDVASQAAFAEKYSLPFSLLSDADAATATAYGVSRTMGPFQFARRQSFIIGPDGAIIRHYEKIDAERHTAEVLADLKALLSQS